MYLLFEILVRMTWHMLMYMYIIIYRGNSHKNTEINAHFSYSDLYYKYEYVTGNAYFGIIAVSLTQEAVINAWYTIVLFP